jgi:hypothetical protein
MRSLLGIWVHFMALLELFLALFELFLLHYFLHDATPPN